VQPDNLRVVTLLRATERMQRQARDQIESTDDTLSEPILSATASTNKPSLSYLEVVDALNELFPLLAIVFVLLLQHSVNCRRAYLFGAFVKALSCYFPVGLLPG